jgi:uncharacterized Zn-finger protein
MKKVSVMYTDEVYCLCPFCQELLDGWMNNPTSDEIVTCDYCGKEFILSAEHDIEFNG